MHELLHRPLFIISIFWENKKISIKRSEMHYIVMKRRCEYNIRSKEDSMSNVIDSAWYGSPPNKEFIGRCHWQRPAQYSDTRCYIEIFHLDSTLDCLFSNSCTTKDARLVIYTRIFFFFLAFITCIIRNFVIFNLISFRDYFLDIKNSS